jgi:hypothetical protein
MAVSVQQASYSERGMNRWNAGRPRVLAAAGPEADPSEF